MLGRDIRKYINTSTKEAPWPNLSPLWKPVGRNCSAPGNLKDMRPGSIVRAVWRCSKPNCHFARPDDPGHGPNLRLTYKWRGKTVTEALPAPAAARKAQQEIAEFRSYQQLGHELVEVSEQVCRLRLVAVTLAQQEKTAETIQQKVAREVDQPLTVIFNGRRKTGRLDLEAIKMAVRSALHRAGAALGLRPPGKIRFVAELTAGSFPVEAPVDLGPSAVH